MPTTTAATERLDQRRGGACRDGTSVAGARTTPAGVYEPAGASGSRTANASPQRGQGTERQDGAADRERRAARERDDAVHPHDDARRRQAVHAQEGGHHRERTPDEHGMAVALSRARERQRDGRRGGHASADGDDARVGRRPPHHAGVQGASTVEDFDGIPFPQPQHPAQVHALPLGQHHIGRGGQIGSVEARCHR